MDVTVIIATYGAGKWRRLAHERALPSALAQGCPVIIQHDPDAQLHEVRNRAAAQATSEWLVFLDADDELAPGYVEALGAASGDLRAPAVSWVTEHHATDPVTLADRDIERLNPCVIGTAIRRDLFTQVGGFADWPAWEDYALFLKAHRAGASLTHVPDAVYRVWMRPGSRNQTVEHPRRLLAQIQAAA